MEKIKITKIHKEATITDREQIENITKDFYTAVYGPTASGSTKRDHILNPGSKEISEVTICEIIKALKQEKQ